MHPDEEQVQTNEIPIETIVEKAPPPPPPPAGTSQEAAAPATPAAEPSAQEKKISELSDAVDQRKPINTLRVAASVGSPYEGFDKTYKQRRLSAFPRLEFYALFSDLIKGLLNDPNSSIGVIDDIINGRGSVNEALDAILSMSMQLLASAPDVAAETIMLSLGVPNHEKPIVRSIWGDPDEEDGTGGLNDDQLEDLLTSFVDQNTKAIVDFFTVRAPRIYRRALEVYSTNQT